MIAITYDMTIYEIIDDPDALHYIISANVKRLRLEKGVSQLQLATDIGLTGNAYIARAERVVDNHHFNVEHLAKIAKALDVDVCVFFEGV